VVPTRNEAEHVEAFVQRVEAALRPFPIDWHAEVIDDSDDDTASILRGLASRGAPLEVTHREEAMRGGALGGAVRAGLGRARGEIVCVIDADLQHPPEILPDLLAPIVLGRADICIGTRYRRGGSAAGLESRWRRLAARGSGVAARWLLPATRLTSDPGSGLFAMRREVIDSVALRPKGSRVLAEILVRGRWRTVCDVPYRFAVTDDGSPRLGTGDAVTLARELLSLWRARSSQPAASRSSRFRRADRLQGRRRVAPVHVELLRGGVSPLEDPSAPSRVSSRSACDS
jgi:glycosyltransferase involved in cell wall biosynthesis